MPNFHNDCAWSDVVKALLEKQVITREQLTQVVVDVALEPIDDKRFVTPPAAADGERKTLDVVEIDPGVFINGEGKKFTHDLESGDPIEIPTSPTERAINQRAYAQKIKDIAENRA